MLGTIVNTCTIVIGTAFGAIVRKGVGEKYKECMFNALGLCCVVLGISTALTNMNKSEFPVLFIISLAVGGAVGTGLELAKKTESLPVSGKDSVNGLVTGILLYCVGTFSIVGPLLSCLSESHGWDLSEPANTYLYTNATLDLVTSAVLAASYGWIMMAAAPILFCWQGAIYCLAFFFATAMPEQLRTEVSIVGGVLILSSGLSILGIKDCKTVNLLPSLLVPVVFYAIKTSL